MTSVNLLQRAVSASRLKMIRNTRCMHMSSSISGGTRFPVSSTYVAQSLRSRRLFLSRRVSTSSSGDETEVAKDVVEEPNGETVDAPPAAVVTEMTPAAAAAATAADDKVASHALPDLFGAKELFDELQDQNQFGKRGEVWTLAQVAAIVLVLAPPFQMTGLVDILATLLITAGVVFMVYALLSLGRFISPLPAPRKVHQLVTSGMYSYLRHPMYGGLLMASFGLAIVTRNETRMALAALLWVVLEQKVKLEEQLLIERYGKSYEDYKEKVKKFFPFVY